jgi:hypothetical protein
VNAVEEYAVSSAMPSKTKAEYMDFLAQWVLQDGKLITPRLLSILMKEHISIAHQ